MNTIIIETIPGTISGFEEGTDKIYPTRMMNIGQDHEDIFEAFYSYMDEMEIDWFANDKDFEVILNGKTVSVLDL